MEPPSIILGQIFGTAPVPKKLEFPFFLPSFLLPFPSFPPCFGKKLTNLYSRDSATRVILLWADQLLVDTMNPYGAPPGASPPRGNPPPGYVHVNLYFCDTFVLARIFDGGLSKEAFFVLLFSGACCYLLHDSILHIQRRALRNTKKKPFNFFCVFLL